MMTMNEASLKAKLEALQKERDQLKDDVKNLTDHIKRIVPKSKLCRKYDDNHGCCDYECYFEKSGLHTCANSIIKNLR